MKIDDGGWAKSSYLNEELDEGGFFNVKEDLKNKLELLFFYRKM